MTTQIRTVSFASDKHTLAGYLAAPNDPGPHPAVVVIHEALGLNDSMRDTAQRFADEGYVALAVDLFAGRNRAVCLFRFFIKVYPGARHSFFNDRRGNYNAEASADAWQRTLAYFNTRLGVG